MTSIFETLKHLQLTSEKTKELFSSSTRDVEELNVFRDKESGIIYIDNFYVGDSVYVDGKYRSNSSKKNFSKINDPQVEIDATRRFDDFKHLCDGKAILDFGCGEGIFLQKMKGLASQVIGIELQETFLSNLAANGIHAHNTLGEISDESLDVIFLFHVFEHLPKPLETLEELRKKLRKGGLLILEVPHANDFLLSFLKIDSFKKFTLWSQHLVLHTKESIKAMLDWGKFNDIKVEGVQRYPLSNHIHWIHSDEPGGHFKEVAAIDSKNLHQTYEASLDKINATDTIVAYGSK